MTMYAYSMTFPAQTQTPALARRWLRDRLGPGHPLEDSALLLVSEAITNAIQHAAKPGGLGQVTVGFALEDHRLQVEVLDDGFSQESPHIVHDSAAEHGRGVQLIDAIAKDWGYQIMADGRGRLHFTLAP